MSLSRLRFAAALLSALLGSTPVALFADSFPTRTVRIISPYTPGGPNDVLSRIVAEKLAQRLGQAVVVENRPGAGGTIGAELVANAKADGHTLLMMAVAHCAHPALYSNLRYDVARDFAPVSVVAVQPLLLVVGTQTPAKTLGEFLALARAKPGELFYGSGGNGTSQHLAMEMVKRAAGINLTHVPYKGLNEALADVFGGQLAAMMSPISTTLPHAKAGKLRTLAIASRKRSALLPQLPTMDELGLRGLSADAWHGLVAPKGTPSAVIERLRREVVASLAMTDVKEKLATQGAEPVGNTPREFVAMIQAEMQKYGRLIKEAGIEGE